MIVRPATGVAGGWLSLAWIDSRLQWNPDQYGGATSLTTVCAPMDRKVSEVWAPQIALWTPGAVLEHTLSNQLCLVTNEGSVTWSRPGTHQRSTALMLTRGSKQGESSQHVNSI